jgi:putative endonuclease
MQYFGAVYINTNKHHTVFYTGVSSDLISRIRDHKRKRYSKSFSARYNVDKLVYYELFFSIVEAIEREKRIKGWSRAKKIKLINEFNPEWKDLYEDLCPDSRHSESAHKG